MRLVVPVGVNVVMVVMAAIVSSVLCFHKSGCSCASECGDGCDRE